ncbi:WecB/TagA/CpsF family glycosyltransferase [Amaricoccus macauensis]|uniref:WecB/TagA/CpsF family glycosyltransferase n=1 Tax=Amaricoccus macauensis TaxID=57001 RepID=UPI003C7CCD35
MNFAVLNPDNMRRVPHVRIAGIPAAVVSELGLAKLMSDDCSRFRAGLLRRPVTVMDVNGQAVSLFARDPDYARALESASIVHADGQFLVTFSRFCSRKIPERTATTDFIHAAAQKAQDDGLSFYLLGGEEGIARECADRLKELYPNLQVAGYRSGYFSEEEEESVIEEVNASGADIVWVGLGKPKEQLFVSKNRSKLHCAWVVTCGGCFNFITGDYSRAPKWMQAAGMEWIHRMLTGPRYLLTRYLTTVPHALWLTLYWMIAGRNEASVEFDQKKEI